MIARRDVLYFAPIDKLQSPLILDLGCGTGIWAIDVAEYVELALLLFDVQLDLRIIPAVNSHRERSMASTWLLYSPSSRSRCPFPQGIADQPDLAYLQISSLTEWISKIHGKTCALGSGT